MSASAFADTVPQGVTMRRFSGDSLRVPCLANFRAADPRSRFYG